MVQAIKGQHIQRSLQHQSMTEETSRFIPMEPESEVHSVESQSQRDSCSETLDSGGNKTKFTETKEKDNDTTTLATQVVSPCFSQTMREEKEEDTKVDYDEIFGFDFSSWSGEDHSEFRNSVALFREEASRLDAVLAMDKIDRLESELRALRNDLNNRCEELEEMQEILQLKDSRISALEMERDLYKADSKKLQIDLQSCITKFQALYESSSIPGGDKTEESAQLRPSPRRLDPPSCVGASTISQSASTATKTTLSRSSHSMSHGTIPSHENPLLGTSLRNHAKSRQTKRRMFLLCRSSKQQENKSHPALSSENDSSMELDLSLEEQVEEMGVRLAASLAASEELRRRIAMLSKHHCCKIKDLQIRVNVAEQRETHADTRLAPPVNQDQEQKIET
jgi:hypothetical protein